MWADRVALGLFELLAIAILVFAAINYFASALPITMDEVYGVFVGGASLVVRPPPPSASRRSPAYPGGAG
jgi:hypothetical protein